MWTFAYLLGAVVLTAWVWCRQRIELNEADREESDRNALRRRIELDPNNLAAYELLGDNLRRAGRLAEASEAYAAALSRIDETTTDTRIAHQLRYKREHVDRDIDEATKKRPAFDNLLNAHRKPQETLFCPHCGAPNTPDRVHCELCGELLPATTFSRAFELSFQHLPTRRALVNGLVLMIAVILVLRVFAGLSSELRGILTISACVAAVLRLAWPRQG